MKMLAVRTTAFGRTNLILLNRVGVLPYSALPAGINADSILIDFLSTIDVDFLSLRLLRSAVLPIQVPTVRKSKDFDQTKLVILRILCD